jgi:predicted ATPase
VLKKLEVKNFLALRHVSIDLEPFTVIVGPNASGKSTILEALHRLSALRSGQHRVLVEGGNFSEQLSNQVWMNPTDVLSKNSEPFIKLGVYCEIGNVVIDLHSKAEEYAFLEKWQIDVQTQSQNSPLSFSYASPKLLHKSRGGAVTEVFPFDEIKKIVSETINLRPNGQKMALASVSPLKKPILESDGSGLATVCANIQQEQPDVFERIQEFLRLVIPTVKRFRIRRTEATAKNYVNGSVALTWTGIAEELIFDFVDAFDIPAKYVSEGTLLALCVLTAAARFEGEALVLLDDLERGLHPKAVHDLVKTLRELQKVNPKLQIVATSHSPYVLDELEPQEVRVVTRDAEKGTIVGRLTDHPNFEKWKDAMLPGEFWSHVGEDWLLEKKQNA